MPRAILSDWMKVAAASSSTPRRWSSDAERVAGADALFVDELLLVLLSAAIWSARFGSSRSCAIGLDRQSDGIRGERRDAGGAECAHGQKQRAGAMMRVFAVVPSRPTSACQ